MQSKIKYARPVARVFGNGVRLGFGLCTALLSGLSFLVLWSYFDTNREE